MDAQIVCEMLGYSSIINYTILLIWFIVFTFAKKWIYNLHSKWFSIDPRQYDMLHYKLMAQFKLLIFVFNLAPFFALCIIL